ncbi:hypothetical protein [Deinococcus alpinitundrae]|uniref:hypothetical protein n=1 Tax=Deinococcus alpinitundrae TaxID=468913 RepID=UPI001379BC66|nr:hypothetical protein [Deinococcus alpinitundrae]
MGGDAALTVDQLLYGLGLILNRDPAGNYLSNAPPNPLPKAPYAVTQLLNGSRETLLHGGAQTRRAQVLISIYGFTADAAGFQSCGIVLAHLRARAREVDRLAGYPRITECQAADESPVMRDVGTQSHYASIRFVLSFLQGVST